jgi:hypothetical protein
MREEILQYQHDFYKNARQEATKENGKGIVFGDEKDAAKTFHLAEILKRQHIEFHELKADFTSNGKQFKKGHAYIIPKNQKNTRMINAMFEKRTTFQDSLFYDVSAWTFPLAFGLDYEENISTSNAGEKVENLEMKTGTVSSKGNYAYLMEWHEYYTPKALNAILNSGLRAKVGLEQFSMNGKDYDYGTLLIPVQNQNKSATELYAFLQKIAEDSHVQIDAVKTGLTEGIDLGSRKFRNLKQPKVAMIVGEGISSYDAGEMRHLFDQRFDMLLTKLDNNAISSTNLDRYNTIILPSGRVKAGATKKLKEWVQKGGTLIGYRSALNWLKSNEFIKLEFKKKELVAEDITFEQRGDFRGAQVIGGAIFEANLDRSHPINFGYKSDKIALFRNNTLFMKADKQSYNNPIKYTKTPLLSGYISKPNLDSLALTVPFKVKNLGKGSIVVFTDNTNFRGFWYGTNKLLMNAIFFREEL